MPDITVQRGTADIGNTGGTAAPGTDFGSTSSAFVRNLCNRRTSAGFGTGNNEGDDISGGVRITAVDTITFGRVSTGGGTARFAWESWEYTGSPGGANEFIVRGRFQLTLGNGTRQTSSAVSGVVDHNNCIAFVTGILTTHTSDAADSLTALAWVDSSDNLQVEKGGNNSNSVDVWVTVVEFTGSAWTVHHGRQEGGGSGVDGGTITLRDESDGLGGSTSSVSAWSQAAIFHQYRANLLNEVDDSIADTSAVYGDGATTGEVDYLHHSNHTDSASAGSRNTHLVQVLEHADMVVTRPASDSQNTAGTMPVTISAGLTDIAHASLEVSRYSSGNGTAYGRGWCTAQLTSTTNVDLWAHRSGNTIATLIQVMDLVGIETAGGGTSPISGQADGTSTASATLTARGSLGGTTAALATAAATLLGTGALSSTVDVTSTAQATGQLVAALAGQADGISSSTATVSATGELAGSIAGTSTATASTSGVAQIDGSSAGLASALATLTGSASLSGTVSATSTTTADLVGFGELDGQSLGTSTATATATAGGSNDISGTIAGTSSATATAVGLGELAAVSTCTSSAITSLAGLADLGGLSQGTSTATASALGSSGLSGTLAGTSSATALLEGQGALSCVALGSSSATATLSSSGGNLAATVACASTCVATLTAQAQCEGQADGASTATASLVGGAALQGASSGTSTTQGAVSGWGALAATSPGEAVVSASLLGIGALQGATVGSSSALASLVPPADLDIFTGLVVVQRTNAVVRVPRTNVVRRIVVDVDEWPSV